MLRKFTTYGKNQILKIMFKQAVTVATSYYVHAMRYDLRYENVMGENITFWDSATRMPNSMEFYFDPESHRVVQKDPAYFHVFGFASDGTNGWAIKESDDPLILDDCLVFGTFHEVYHTTGEPRNPSDMEKGYYDVDFGSQDYVHLLERGSIQFWLENKEPDYGFANFLLHNSLKVLFCGEFYMSEDTYVVLLKEPIDSSVEYITEMHEVQGTGYERIKVHSNDSELSPNWGPVQNGSVSNNDLLTWVVSDSDWSNVVGLAVVSSEGLVLQFDCKNIKPFTPEVGKSIKIFPNTLSISIQDK